MHLPIKFKILKLYLSEIDDVQSVKPVLSATCQSGHLPHAASQTPPPPHKVITVLMVIYVSLAWLLLAGLTVNLRLENIH